MTTSTVAYAVASAADPGRILEGLEQRFRVHSRDARRWRVTYYDTFDWRIHRDGGCLRLAQEATSRGAARPRAVRRRGPSLSWRDLEGRVRHRLPAATVPPFAREFPPGPFRDALAPVTAMRRLLPVVELELGGRVFEVRDRRDKTVVRLRLEHAAAAVPGASTPGASAPDESAPVDPLPALLRVLPVRGYTRERQKVVRALESHLGLERASDSELDRALAAIGRQADDYSSKVQIELEPAMPAAAAAKLIHRTLLAVIRRNEAGTREDLDSEFLHDFRVAVRRTRSALSQIKGVYPAADLARFQVEFKWLGGLTGPTRDLDVYLLKMDDYRAELPASVRADLEPLGDFLVRRQRREQRRMVRQLDEPRYAALLAAWDRFLNEPADLGAAANAGRPIGEVARRRIWKVYRRVIKKGLAIHDDTPAAALHELRIECKKLRYLMEFFRGLYDRGNIGRLIKALKQLQDNLGDLNDYDVQQRSLRTFAEEMRGSAPAATVMAMGRLVEHLAAGQVEERHDFAARFAAFARADNRQLARDLFAPPSRKDTG